MAVVQDASIISDGNNNPVAEPIDILTSPIKIVIDGSENPTSALPILPANATAEALKEIVKAKKVDCTQISASYVCGVPDAPATQGGDIVPVASGDEIAINSIGFEVVAIDASGNGSGLVKIPMMDRVKIGVTFEGIQVAKGGCVTTGRAILSGVEASILNEQQRQNLQVIYAAFNAALDLAADNAGAIAKTYNNITELLKDVRNQAKTLIDKIAAGKTPSKKELKELSAIAQSGITTKQSELDVLKKQPGADTSKYVKELSLWISTQKEGQACAVAMQNNTTTTTTNETKPGGKPFAETNTWFLADCSLVGLTMEEPTYNYEELNSVGFTTFKELANGNIEFSNPKLPNPTIWLAPIILQNSIVEEQKVQQLLHPKWNSTKCYLHAGYNVYKGIIHSTLDLAGLIPLAGELADGTNAVIYLAEGDKVNASLSAISMIPVVGDAAGKGTKYTRKVLTWFKVGNRYFSSTTRKAAYEVIFNKFGSAKIADAIWDGANSSLCRNVIIKAGKAIKEAWQAHHIIPKELIDKNPIIRNAIEQGFDFNTLENLIPLAETRHLGSHGNYTAQITSLIEKIDQSKLYKTYTDKQKIEKAVEIVTKRINMTTGKINDLTFNL